MVKGIRENIGNKIFEKKVWGLTDPKFNSENLFLKIKNTGTIREVL